MATHKNPTERATESLYEFVRQAWPHVESQTYVDSWHVEAVCNHLEAVSRGDIMKLLINIPPGCSKSLLVCVFWMCWEWTHAPETRWFYASYGQDLSTRDSTKCRNLIESNWYQERWGHVFKFAKDQNQKTKFENDKGGWRLATTPSGQGTGQHPDRIVVDDPHNVKQAESAAERKGVLDWWDLTMPTRGLSRGARRVMIGQRLHEEDLYGHVLKESGWDHICLPMRYEPDRMKATKLGWTDPRKVEGEILTPLFTEDSLAAAEEPLGPYGIAGQMQQRPSPRAGGMFQFEWFEIVDRPPNRFTQLIRGWDFAYTEDDGDYSAGVLVGTAGDDLWILDVVFGQWASGKRDEQIQMNLDADQMVYGGQVVTWFPQDPAAGKQVAEILASRLQGYAVKYETVGKNNKEVRAQPLASRCWAIHKRGGKVKLLKNQNWNRKFLNELCSFPMAKHDDIVDAATTAFNKLAKGRKPCEVYVS